MNPTPRIMLVEDSRTQALQLTHVFQREGWQVAWSRTAEDAIERLREFVPDVLVLDHYLPGIRGGELCRQLRMNVNLRSLPILMLTADNTHTAELHGLESGADDFVSKSVDADVLVLRLRTLLGKAHRQPAIITRASDDLRTARLLCIDDSHTYQQFLNEELREEGYQVEHAMSGPEGLERLSQDHFDCVLVDLAMPEMDGIEVCRRINQRRHTLTGPIAVLMVTASENKEDLTRALNAGADDFVGKSSDTAVLKGRIRAMLRRMAFEEENLRILEELKYKELETLRAVSEKEVAEAKAALNDELEQRVHERTAELAKVNREMAAKNDENEMFVYSVSHDLRSPLVNLKGFSHELTDTFQELGKLFEENDIPAEARQRGLTLLNDEMSPAIHFIQTAVTRLSNIIDALLRLSRAGRIEYQPQQLDMQRIIHCIVDSMSGTIAERQATVTFGELRPLWGDPTAIEQVFANLIGNAVNYLAAERPGVIEIGSLTPDSGTQEPDTGEITYYVKDNGLGISAAYLPKLFHAFQRLHPEICQGEGIGLAVVRRIVDRHGGTIRVESEANVGTTFYVSLPDTPAENVQRTPEEGDRLCKTTS